MYLLADSDIYVGTKILDFAEMLLLFAWSGGCGASVEELQAIRPPQPVLPECRPVGQGMIPVESV